MFSRTTQYVFIICSLTSTIIFCPPKKPQPQQIVINLNQTQQNDQNSALQNTNEVSSSLVNHAKNFLAQPFMYREQFEKTLDKEKFKLFFAAFIGGYFYIAYQLKKAVTLIQNQTAWCSWMQIKDTFELTSMPHDQIAHILIQDIQRKYLINHKSVGIDDPFKDFLHDIKYEITTLNRYLSLQKIITRCYASLLFFIKPETVQAVEDRLKRVTFIYNTFVLWNTNRNIT